jgi:N-acetylglucosaminyldiphosphoundecaprenol N-acetyl-beta-D-mannosaminyltransferase
MIHLVSLSDNSNIRFTHLTTKVSAFVEREPNGAGGVTSPALRSDFSQRKSPAHCEFQGLRFCQANFEQTLCLILTECDGPFGYVVTPNAPHIVAVHERSDELLPIYSGAWLSLCDSQIVRRLAALRGLALPLVTGSDLVAAMLADQNSPSPRWGRKKLLAVGPDGDAGQQLQARYPNISVEILPAPAQLAQRPDLRLQVARACVARPWDILLLCVGCPAQELIAALIAQLGRSTGVALCVGASIDFAIGRRARAPRLLQILGLEWAYRLSLEPRRLWRRYLIGAPKLLRIFLMNGRTARD